MSRWRRPSSSLTARITLASTLVGLAVACGAGLFGYWAVVQHLDDRAELELRGRRQQVLHVMSEMSGLPELAAVRHRFDDIMIGHEGLHLALEDAKAAKVLVSFSRTAAESVNALAALPDSEEVRQWHHDHDRWAALKNTFTLQTGESVRYYLSTTRVMDDELIRHYVQAILFGVPLLLLLVAVGAWGVSKAGLAPLHRFNRVAASIGARSLHQRLAESDLPVELSELAREFNAMLDRIDASYGRLLGYAGDLAHEMRTPVAILLGRSQVALSQHRSVAELREVLEGNVEEMVRLSGLIDDILFMAKADDESASLHLVPVQLEELALRIAEFLSLQAEEKGVSIEVGGAAAVTADELLVERAVTNLLSNAVRHAASGTVVRVKIEAAGKGACVSVANAGEGIPPQHLPRIFDRFYRVDSSRTRADGGTGLGLAIVKAIMRAHRGSVDVMSEPGGQTTFTLNFPA